jgi:hypothetical protein
MELKTLGNNAVMVCEELLQTLNKNSLDEIIKVLLESEDTNFLFGYISEIKEALRLKINYLIKQAFIKNSDEALLIAHRMLYSLYEQHMLLNNFSYNKNQYNPFFIEIKNLLEEKWEEQELKKIEHLIVDLPSNKDEFLDWLNSRKPHVSPLWDYIEKKASLEQIKEVVIQYSIDNLIEASQMSFNLAGYYGPIQTEIAKIISDEYGHGNFNRKHSTLYAKLLEDLSLNSEYGYYFDRAYWATLAYSNLYFFMTLNKKNFYKYLGGIYYTETFTPIFYQKFLNGLKRIGITNKDTLGYVSEHIYVDKVHADIVLKGIILPAIEKIPSRINEIITGYHLMENATMNIDNMIYDKITAIEKSDD